MSEKTEQPTPKKLRDVRKKGQVAKSKEVASAALIVTAFMLLFALMPSFVNDIHRLILIPTHFYESEFELAANAVSGQVVRISLMIFGPIVAAIAVVGIIANVAQFGVLFSAQSIKPKLSNLNPGAAVKRVFGKKNLVEFLKSAVKIAFLSILLLIVVRNSLNDLIKIPHCGLGCLPAVLGKMLWQIVIYTSAAFVIIAAADFAYQKWQFLQENKMTKDEVKREYKESEGDPHIKGKRRQFAQELTQASEDEKVRKSTVVVTNPTHIAIALDYREDETPLPIIAAMGQNVRARRIVQVAQQAGVPIMQNVPLARGLYETASVNQYIPSDLIEPVVEVLKWVRDLENENG